MVQTATVTGIVGDCDTEVGYQYRVYYRPDGTYQTREMDGTLTDSGTYKYQLTNQPSVAQVDFVTYPAVGTVATMYWHEVMHFDTRTIEGSQVGGTGCTYTATFSLEPN
jgi:hypothetical protein